MTIRKNQKLVMVRVFQANCSHTPNFLEIDIENNMFANNTVEGRSHACPQGIRAFTIRVSFEIGYGSIFSPVENRYTVIV